jgi:hypothetical protein
MKIPPGGNVLHDESAAAVTVRRQFTRSRRRNQTVRNKKKPRLLAGAS